MFPLRRVRIRDTETRISSQERFIRLDACESAEPVSIFSNILYSLLHYTSTLSLQYANYIPTATNKAWLNWINIMNAESRKNYIRVLAFFKSASSKLLFRPDFAHLNSFTWALIRFLLCPMAADLFDSITTITEAYLLQDPGGSIVLVKEVASIASRALSIVGFVPVCFSCLQV